MNYILEGHDAVLVKDIQAWGRWYEAADRTVAKTKVTDDTEVSTVFLGIDHAFGVGEEPILFETRVFGGPLDQEQVRYTTWDEAERGHKSMVLRVEENPQ